MSITRPKIALNNATIPPVSTLAQRAVFNPSLDSAPRTPRTFMGGEDSADYNMAQIVYAENVMPSAHGVRSVSLQQVVVPTVNKDFDTIFPLRDAQENAVYYSPAKGKNYVYDRDTSTWVPQSHTSIWALDLTPESDVTTSRVTYAYVDGKTFVCYSRLQSTTGVDMSIMKWDETTQSLVPATTIISNLPFDVGTIDGIASSNGFLLVWSGLEIAWAFFNGTDFNYTIYDSGNYTGSGNQIPEDVQGPITAILGMAGGFVAFTARNCVSANYHAQTIQSPWVFREVTDAGGLESYEQATVEGSLGKIVAYTSAGFQAITLNSAEHAHPVIADFVIRREAEIYDRSSHQLVKSQLPADLGVKVTAIGNRYLVVSYGFYAGIYSFALVYDIALKRWGKIRVRHTDCFAYNYGTTDESGVAYSSLLDVRYEDLPTTPYDGLSVSEPVITPAAHALAFLADSGEISLASWSAGESAGETGVLIVGRVQLSRSRFTQLNRIELEGVTSGDVYVQASTNGRTISYLADTVVVEHTDDYMVTGCMVDCKNFNIVLEGVFDLTTLIVEITQSGEN